MSCDLTDPAITETYNAIVSGAPTNWLILGYHDTRDKISLYSNGAGGLEELRANLKEEVLYGFVRIEDRFALLSYVSEQVSGLRRELSDDKIRSRLGLVDGPPTPDPSGSPVIPSSPLPVAAPRPTTPVSPASPPTSNSPMSGVSSPARSGSPLPGASTPRTERQLEIEAAERKTRDEMERQKKAETVKRQKETQEREAREQDMQAQKQAQELERKRKEEAERVAREAMKKQLIEMEKLRGSGLSGYITIQTSGSPVWKRRFYMMQGQAISLYRDENDRHAVSELKLGGRVTNIEDASLDCLIPNSFRVDLYTGESHLFFCDSTKDKELAIAGFMKCNESS
ncbi:hypothetical protein BG011_002132 [Mortierella polycephala]|uniref:ADF-H domain-containing protein n=1 Tax=Mortierella polycephala TaxID=41804 RepID=A0A9P6Q601_9FUNG|nr:hypothetical protein BG011_002132 [Mortierella polycephala]